MTTTAIDLTRQDPWTPILAQLWAILEADPAFCALVLPGNRIKFTAKNPMKDGDLQPGGCPEVTILPGNKAADWAVASLTVESDPVFVIQVLTNDMRLTFTDPTTELPSGANLLEWLICRDIAAAGDSLGISYVTECRINTSLTLHVEGEQNRGHKGWAVLITVKVRCNVDRTGDIWQSQGEYAVVPSGPPPYVPGGQLLVAEGWPLVPDGTALYME